MPGPGGQSPIDEFRASSAVASPGQSPHQTLADVSRGYRSLASYLSPVLGAAFDYASQLQSQHEQESYNSREAAKARAFSAQQASAAQAFNRSESRWAAQWNSPEHQVQQFKAAGLSPGLMYGQMAPTTAQGASGSPGGTVQAASAASSSSGFGKAVDSVIQAHAVSSNAALQQTEAARNEIESMRVAIDNVSLHQRNLAQYDQMLASGELDHENAQRVRQLRDLEAQQLTESINNLVASSNKIGKETEYIEKVQTPLGQADKKLKDAQAATEKERPAQVRQDTATSFAQQGLNENLGKESVSRREQIEYANNEYSTHWDLIEKTLEDKGIDKAYTPIAVKFLSHLYPELAQKGSQAVESWLDAHVWVDFFSRWIASKNIGRANAYGHVIDEEKKK